MGAIITSTTKEFFACNIDLVFSQFFALLFIAKLHTHPMNLKPIILLFILRSASLEEEEYRKDRENREKNNCGILA
jgi:hypothetical protein